MTLVLQHLAVFGVVVTAGVWKRGIQRKRERKRERKRLLTVVVY